MKLSEANIERKLKGDRPFPPEQWFKLSSANTAQTMWEIFPRYWGELWPNISARLSTINV